jgi:hypothetical protein
MANITWPEMLPSGLLENGFTKQPKSSVIRTKMDAGPEKSRRRYTARSVGYSGRQVFDKAEFAVFEQFFHIVLADGVLRFNFEDPVTLEMSEFRFTADYSAAAVEGYYEVTMQLEKL